MTQTTQGVGDQIGQGERKSPVSSFVHGARLRSCRTWLLAFVDGLDYPIVRVAGYGFSYQKAVDALKARAGSGAFAFRNNRGTYFFAGEKSHGTYVLKICADGLSASPSPAGGWIVTPRT